MGVTNHLLTGMILQVMTEPCITAGVFYFPTKKIRLKRRGEEIRGFLYVSNSQYILFAYVFLNIQPIHDKSHRDGFPVTISSR